MERREKKEIPLCKESIDSLLCVMAGNRKEAQMTGWWPASGLMLVLSICGMTDWWPASGLMLAHCLCMAHSLGMTLQTGGPLVV